MPRFKVSSATICDHLWQKWFLEPFFFVNHNPIAEQIMIRNLAVVLIVISSLALLSCESKEERLRKSIESEFKKTEGTFAVAFKDLGTGTELLINEHDLFHAASTMKTPVMIEVYKQAAEGKFALTDSIPVKDEFKSIVDGSPYKLSSADDSYAAIYDQVGAKVPMSALVYYMITSSSNLATNIVIEKVDAKNVTQTMRDFGAKDLLVLRGVEDNKAFQAGLSNKVTAYDLMLIFEKLAKGEAVSKEASESMLDVLSKQEFNTIIPANLPPGTKVAHKTGWIKGLHHDSGIVYGPDGKTYVLVLLSRELKDEDAGVATMAKVSKMIYDYAVNEE
jgi:beta-lactamase class A